MDGVGVCSDHWDNDHSQIVCQELGCRNAFRFNTHGGSDSDVYRVRCHGFESNLGHCETVRGRCDGGLVSVYCTGNGHCSDSFDKDLCTVATSGVGGTGS